METKKIRMLSLGLAALLAAAAAQAQDPADAAPPPDGVPCPPPPGFAPPPPPELGGCLPPGEMDAPMHRDRHAVRELADAINRETDEAKKAELTAQLRERVGRNFDEIQARQEARLEQAERDLEKRTQEARAGLERLRRHIDESKAQREERVEAIVQGILSGEGRIPRGGPEGPGMRGPEDGRGPWHFRCGKGPRPGGPEGAPDGGAPD